MSRIKCLNVIAHSDALSYLPMCHLAVSAAVKRFLAQMTTLDATALSLGCLHLGLPFGIDAAHSGYQPLIFCLQFHDFQFLAAYFIVESLLFGFKLCHLVVQAITLLEHIRRIHFQIARKNFYVDWRRKRFACLLRWCRRRIGGTAFDWHGMIRSIAFWLSASNFGISMLV